MIAELEQILNRQEDHQLRTKIKNFILANDGKSFNKRLIDKINKEIPGYNFRRHDSYSIVYLQWCSNPKVLWDQDIIIARNSLYTVVVAREVLKANYGIDESMIQRNQDRKNFKKHKQLEAESLEYIKLKKQCDKLLEELEETLKGHPDKGSIKNLIEELAKK